VPRALTMGGIRVPLHLQADRRPLPRGGRGRR
jgi:hypothetical protein